MGREFDSPRDHHFTVIRMLIVQKFGGTSVGTIDRIRNVAAVVAAAVRSGDEVVVVVSAMSGVTDNFIALANDLGGLDYPEEKDVVISSGEVVSSGLLSIALNNIGISAKSFQGWQAGLRTDSYFGNAQILHMDTEAVRMCVKQGVVPVICGFQGISYDGRVTTLGRGGSDVTAAAIAAALGADYCDIYTDVDAIYSADPNKFDSVKRINKIGYEAVLAMAEGGAKVLHPRASSIGQASDFDMRIRSSFNASDTGTTITNALSTIEQSGISAISVLRRHAYVTVYTDNLLVLLEDLSSIAFSIEDISRQDGQRYRVSLCASMRDVTHKFQNDDILACSKITLSGVYLRNAYEIIAKILEIADTLGVSIFKTVVQNACVVIYASGHVLNGLEGALHSEFVGGNT